MGFIGLKNFVRLYCAREEKNMKTTIKLVLIILISLTLIGCGESQEEKEEYESLKNNWKMSLDDCQYEYANLSDLIISAKNYYDEGNGSDSEREELLNKLNVAEEILEDYEPNSKEPENMDDYEKK